VRSLASRAAVGGALVLLLGGGGVVVHASTAPEAPVPSPVTAAAAVRGEGAAPRPPPRVRWRPSQSLGTASAGHLVGGVVLPSWGLDHATWDPVLRRSPGRAWRRVGSDRLVRLVLAVAASFRREHPDAPRLLVGDLSRPRGGDFGRRFGGLGHVSHQNGLDVDVYYPRRDRAERPPPRPAEVDLALAQWLVDRFVAAGAVRVFVGPSLPLRGPAAVVAPLPRHDNHLHVRIAAE
jgi:murein endopeptidase